MKHFSKSTLTTLSTIILLVLSVVVFYAALPMINNTEPFAEQDVLYPHTMTYMIPQNCDMCTAYMPTWENAKIYAQSNGYQVHMREEHLTAPSLQLYVNDKLLEEFAIPMLADSETNVQHLRYLLAMLQEYLVPHQDKETINASNKQQRSSSLHKALGIPEKEQYTTEDLFTVFNSVNGKLDYSIKYVIPGLCDVCTKFQKTWKAFKDYVASNKYNLKISEQLINAPVIVLYKNAQYVAEYHPPVLNTYTEKHMINVIDFLVKNGVSNTDETLYTEFAKNRQEFKAMIPQITPDSLTSILQQSGIQEKPQYSIEEVRQMLQSMQQM